eukprot:9435310-Ditylum_brightwellii.AAC.1
MEAGSKSLLISSSKQLQSKQAQPNRTSWKLWGKCLKLFAQYDHLKVPLTRWLVEPPQLQRNWPMYIVPTTGSLYVRYNSDFLVYSQSLTALNVYAQGVLTSWNPTPDSFPVHATTIDSAEIWMCCQHHTSIPISQTPAITTFSSYLHTLEHWESSLLDNIILHQPIHLIAQHWLQGTKK